MPKGFEKLFGAYTSPQKRYRLNHPDKAREINRRHFQENKEKILAKRRETRAKQSAGSDLLGF